MEKVSWVWWESVSVDLFDIPYERYKRMVKALPMALPGASQGGSERILGYDRGGDKALRRIMGTLLRGGGTLLK